MRYFFVLVLGAVLGVVLTFAFTGRYNYLIIPSGSGNKVMVYQVDRWTGLTLQPKSLGEERVDNLEIKKPLTDASPSKDQKAP